MLLIFLARKGRGRRQVLCQTLLAIIMRKMMISSQELYALNKTEKNLKMSLTISMI